MSEIKLSSKHEFVLFLTYGQFYIQCGSDGTRDFDALVQDAVGDGTYASDESNIVVISPVSSNPALAVGVEVWTSKPPQDEGEWQIEIRETLTVDDNHVVDLVTIDSTVKARFDLTPGQYNFEVLGRAESFRTGLNRSSPDDRWRIRVWPAV